MTKIRRWTMRLMMTGMIVLSVGCGGNNSLNDKLIETLNSGRAERYEEAMDLLSDDIDVNYINEDGRTAVNLVVAVSEYDSKETRDGCEAVLEYLMARCNTEQLEKETRTNPLIEAARYNNIKAMEYLLENHYYDVNGMPAGMSAMMVAAREDNVEACKLLLEYGADRKLKSYEGKTAYVYAAQYNDDEMEIICPCKDK